MVTIGNSNGMVNNGTAAINAVANVCAVVGAGFILYKACSISYHMGEKNAEQRLTKNNFGYYE